LILLTNSFIFPVFADKVDKLKKKMSFEVVVLFIFVFVIEIFWLFTVIKVPAANFQDHLGFLLLELLKILVLYSPIYYIIANMNKFGRYGPHIIIAFLVYMITPITNVINFVFFDCSNNNLVVFAHPFLFISILLFTRVTFLKLVDKATLKRELAETKQKYVHEHELSIMKDEFVSTVSHELRTPITSMKLYLSLLRQKKFGVLNNKQLKAVKIVENESNRLSKLISDILNLSRLESKKVAVKIDEVNLRRLINDNLYYNLAEQKGLIIENKILKKFLVKIDSEKFKQVFINLFSNAVSYAKSKIIIFASKKTNYWEFIIEDDGVGIPKDKIDKLFDKFYRIGDYLTKDKGGTGLGLAIVKNIVKMHRGEIIVESEEGKGSRFIVRIPYL
ncbi:MAG: HAMP domain-containing histidine kinase, partial [Nanoarchaeota archaeon]|nr:HAMP domain-containing histidine kinase [Nanoarchaeota archaeon]